MNCVIGSSMCEYMYYFLHISGKNVLLGCIIIYFYGGCLAGECMMGSIVNEWMVAIWLYATQFSFIWFIWFSCTAPVYEKNYRVFELIWTIYYYNMGYTLYIFQDFIYNNVVHEETKEKYRRNYPSGSSQSI